ncbi:hypothetical protein, partial [Erwinia mallotivora]|uniref:hypothetical protein n=1 Tax=Erwinia mallotivora TaxID=69222 RepID=UPI0021C0787F
GAKGEEEGKEKTEKGGGRKGEKKKGERRKKEGGKGKREEKKEREKRGTKGQTPTGPRPRTRPYSHTPKKT